MKEKRIIPRIFAAAAASALFLSIGFLSVAAEKYRQVDTSLKVYDYAQLFSEEEEAELRRHCLAAADASACDVFVVTVDENNVAYESSDRTLSFLEDFGDYNGFGRGEDSNYISFIIDMQERKYNIDVAGEHSLKVFTTERQEAQKDVLASCMKNGDYFAAADSFADFVENCGAGEVSSFVGSQEEWEAQRRNQRIGSVALALLQSLAIAAAAGGVVVLVKSRTAKTVHKAADAYAYADLSTFRITNADEKFVRRYSTTRVIQPPPSGGHSAGGGRSGGHTVTHRASGGRSHGGGGSRGF